jgi:hypothetical protein
MIAATIRFGAVGADDCALEAEDCDGAAAGPQAAARLATSKRRTMPFII